MKKIAFGLLLIVYQISFGQTADDSLQILLTDTTQVSDTIQVFDQIVFNDSITDTATDTAKNNFLISSYHFIDSVKHAKENYFLEYTHNIWNDSAHSPGKAALFSALLPGLGQAYNGKWWKIPIVYAALGTTTGFVLYNTYGKYGYLDLKKAIILRLDGDSTTIDQYANDPSATDDALLIAVDEVKRYLDISYIVTAFVYLLNIIDAVVDAQLFYFDVSDDLSMRIDPYIHYNAAYNTSINYSSLFPAGTKPVFGIQINLHIQ